MLIQSFNDQFSIAWNLAIDFQCFFEAFSVALLAQSGDSAPAWGDYPSALSNFLTVQPFLFGNASLWPLESEVFQLTEWGIRLWFSLMEEIDKIGGWTIIEGKLTWAIQEYVLYYLMLFSIGFGIFSWKPLKLFFQTRHGFRKK